MALQDAAGPSLTGKVRDLYTSAAANRSSQIADWAAYSGDGDEIIDELAYAAGKSVVIARSAARPHQPPAQVITTAHAQITALKFAFPTSGSGVPKLLAASGDGWLYLFARDGKGARWQMQHQWLAREENEEGADTSRKAPLPSSRKSRPAKGGSSVRALGILRRGGQATGSSRDGGFLFASATSDGYMQVWAIKADRKVERLQDISLGRSRAETKTEVLPLDIAIARVPNVGNALLLAVAGTDAKVDMMLAEDGANFKRLFSLLGHTDWVRSLDFCLTSGEADGRLLLASASQDNGIRVWRIEQTSSVSGEREQAATSRNDLDEFDKLASQIEEGEEEVIATKMLAFSCSGQRYSVSLDALLLGHEHWVTGVRWAPICDAVQPAALLSSSADNSVILWTPSSCVTQVMSTLRLPQFPPAHHDAVEGQHAQDVWVAVQRFGEVGNVGSAANGMYGVAWHPAPADRLQAVMAHGYGGALHVWSRALNQDGHAQPWKAQPGLGGHFAPATSVRWESGGQYFISGGMDKTTRLHGCFRNREGSSWHQIARPQTHGYEIIALAWLSRLAIASAGDEKVIRVFEAPKGFISSADKLNLVTSDEKAHCLAFYLPSLAHLLHPDHLAKAIKEATRRSLHKGRLDLVVVSDLFEGVERNEALNVSFAQVEGFLKWCYAQAWSEAVEADELLFDVDVMLLGTGVAAERLEERRQGDACFVIDGGPNQLPFEVLEAIKLHADSPDDAAQTQGTEKFPQHSAIAMGGTFDHLHVGHKILLSMACLLATQRVVIGVTDDSMLSKKKHASVLESTQERISRVARFMAKFCNTIGRTGLKHDVVTLQDVAGPAGTDADLTALLFTDETVGGADFIDGEREKRGLKKLDRFTIGLIGAAGETDVQGKDTAALAAAKVGSTAIRGWLEKRSGGEGAAVAPAKRLPALDQVPTLNGEPRPVGASVPPLGLSNRAIYSAGSEPVDGPSETGQPVGKATRSIAQQLSRPPVEEELHNHSLWSEVSKLYGHPLELLALDVDSNSGLIASSCKATQAELAGVRLHDSRQGWKEVQCLTGHALGVTRLRFSADGQRLVTVSRDRSWRVFKRRTADDDSEQGGPFELECAREESHSRIIYDVAWLDNSTFATASRDKIVKVWNVRTADQPSNAVATITLTEPATAIAAKDGEALAVGTDSGNVQIFEVGSDNGWQQHVSVTGLHADAISELAWRPYARDAPFVLASAAEDGIVRLTEIVM